MTCSSALRQFVSAVVPRPLVRFVWNAASDLKDLPRRFSDDTPPQPWRLMHNVGGGDYHRTGRYFADKIVEQTGLQPNWSVLDIGCGTGRIGAPLIQRLGEGGSYTGFDLSASAIRWARKHVASPSVSVQFLRADLSNTEYNRSGERRASQYVFPAAPGSMDLCIAISLFTHLKREDAQRYLHECARVLKPGGKVFLTAFLMNDKARQRVQDGRARMAFQPLDASTYTTDLKTPEHAIAFDQGEFFNWVDAAQLVRVSPMVPGNWSDRTRRGDLQDLVVLEKPVRPAM